MDTISHRDILSNLQSRGYVFSVFFSLPFCPVFLKMFRVRFNYGHLAVGLGDTVYQVVEPKRLRSNFLISRMPVADWLYEDGPWHEWDRSSPRYRHVHLFEKAEVKRTVIFYALLKGFPPEKQKKYVDYFEAVEQGFQEGRHEFKLFFNNCAQNINYIFYQEGWIPDRLFDFVPALAFKRLIDAWEKAGLDFKIGCIDENRDLRRFQLQNICPGIFSANAHAGMMRWLRGRNKACRVNQTDMAGSGIS